MLAPVQVVHVPVLVAEDNRTMLSSLKNWFVQKPLFPPPAGLYHYLKENQDEKVRFHLRIDQDGNGCLLVNANHIYYLNPSAIQMAYLILEKVPLVNAISLLARSYNASLPQLYQDYRKFSNQISTLTLPGACPICDADLQTVQPFSIQPSAPYRMDLAITYQCNNACYHCYNARPRQYPTLSKSEWKQVIDILWQIGIPHIVFTGGEPTLIDDLPDLIAHAQNNGQITGINTNGRRLKDKSFLQELVSAGLDHVQITFESHDPAIHDQIVKTPSAWQDTVAGLQNALETRLFVMTNTTLLLENSPYLKDTLEFLAKIKVPTIGLNALIHSGKGLNVKNGLAIDTLSSLLSIAQQITQKNNQRLIWYTPTEYCHFDPMQLNLGVKGCTAASYNMCVEPDGNVIPCQSYYNTSLGNILHQPWNSIWNHEVAIQLRERKEIPSECAPCPLFVECGGGCPLSRQTQHANPQPLATTPFLSS